MIDEFVKAWDKNNQELLKLFEKKVPESNLEIVERLITVVINPYLEADENNIIYPLCEGLDISKMTIIDDGCHSGTIIFIVPCHIYQPDMDAYYITASHYGSCSGCDTIRWIESKFHLWDEENRDTIGAAENFHTLALHLLQSFKCLGE